MKLIVADIDATIINSPDQKIPSERFRKVVQDIKSSVLVTCATGRSSSWAKPVLKTAGFTAPCIIGGGTIILDPVTFKPLLERFIPQNQLDNIKDILRNYPNSHVLFNDYTEEEYLAGGWPVQKLIDSNSCYIMEVIELDHETADELIAQFKKLDGVTSIKMNSLKQHFVDIHIVNENATKEAAIQWVQQYTGINKADTVGIGDGYNDFHIFNASGTKIAVGNAIAELKEMADEIIGNVRVDGVSEYLEQFRVTR